MQFQSVKLSVCVHLRWVIIQTQHVFPRWNLFRPNDSTKNTKLSIFSVLFLIIHPQKNASNAIEFCSTTFLFIFKQLQTILYKFKKVGRRRKNTMRAMERFEQDWMENEKWRKSTREPYGNNVWANGAWSFRRSKCFFGRARIIFMSHCLLLEIIEMTRIFAICFVMIEEKKSQEHAENKNKKRSLNVCHQSNEK